MSSPTAGLSELEEAAKHIVLGFAQLEGVSPAERDGLTEFAADPREFTPATVASVASAIAPQLANRQAATQAITLLADYLAVGIEAAQAASPKSGTLLYMYSHTAMALGMFVEMHSIGAVASQTVGTVGVVLAALIDELADAIDGKGPLPELNLVGEMENNVHCVVAALATRSSSLREALVVRSAPALRKLRRDSHFTYAAAKMLPDSTPVVVLHPASSAGWTIEVSNVPSMEEVYAMLMRAIITAGGDQAPQWPRDLRSVALFSWFAYSGGHTLAQDRFSTLGHFPFKGSISDIAPCPALGNARVVLVASDFASQAYDRGPDFPWLDATATVTATHAADEVDAMLASIAEVSLADRIAHVQAWCDDTAVHGEWAYACARLVLDLAAEDDGPLLTPLVAAARTVRDAILSPAEKVEPMPQCPACVSRGWAQMDSSLILPPSKASLNLMNVFRDSVYHALVEAKADFTLDGMCSGVGPRGATTTCLVCSRTFVMSDDSDSDVE